jgi:hypothetical protein
MEDDARAIHDALLRLKSLNIAAVEYALPDDPGASNQSGDRQTLQRLLGELGQLLPSWSDNLSSTYFSHVRTIPIAIGE